MSQKRAYTFFLFLTWSQHGIDSLVNSWYPFIFQTFAQRYGNIVPLFQVHIAYNIKAYFSSEFE